MKRATRFSRILLLCLLALVLLGVPAALAEEAETTEAVEDFSGTYQISGSTDGGRQFSATIVVQDGGTKAAITGVVPKVGKLTKVFDVKQTGEGAYEVTGGVWMLVISGSGTVNVTSNGEGFDINGTASGSAFGSKGSVTFAGTRTSTATDSEVSTQIADKPAENAATKEPLGGADDAVKPLTPNTVKGIPRVDDTTKAGVTGVVALLIAIQIILEVITGGGISTSRIGDLLKAGAEVNAVSGTKSEAKTTWDDAMSSGTEGGDE